MERVLSPQLSPFPFTNEGFKMDEQNWYLVYMDKGVMIVKDITVTSSAYLLQAASPYVQKGREGFGIQESGDANVKFITQNHSPIATVIRTR